MPPQSSERIAYADEAERDHAALRTAVRAGLIEVQLERELNSVHHWRRR